MIIADTATTLTGVGAITLLSLTISFTLASAKRARDEYKECRHENAACNWRQAVLIETMHTADLPVPSWIWNPPPEGVEHMSAEEQRSTAQKMIDPYGGRSE